MGLFAVFKQFELECKEQLGSSQNVFSYRSAKAWQ